MNRLVEVLRPLYLVQLTFEPAPPPRPNDCLVQEQGRGPRPAPIAAGEPSDGKGGLKSVFPASADHHHEHRRRVKSIASRQEIADRYGICDDLATALLEKTR